MQKLRFRANVIDAQTEKYKNSEVALLNEHSFQYLPTVAAHLRTFLKECGSFAHTIFPGKRIHLRTKFPQVNVTFAQIRFSQVNGMSV